jgi:hypothetical protein
MTNRPGISKAGAVVRITRPAHTAIKPTLSARDEVAYAAAAKALG